MVDPIIVVVTPDGKGKYFAKVGETELPPKREPFCNAARFLLPTTDPATPLIMRHAGSDTNALISTVGAAAQLTVREDDRGGPTFVPWRPFPGTRYDGFNEKNGEALVGGVAEGGQSEASEAA